MADSLRPAAPEVDDDGFVIFEVSVCRDETGVCFCFRIPGLPLLLIEDVDDDEECEEEDLKFSLLSLSRETSKDGEGFIPEKMLGGGLVSSWIE